MSSLVLGTVFAVPFTLLAYLRDDSALTIFLTYSLVGIAATLAHAIWSTLAERTSLKPVKRSA